MPLFCEFCICILRGVVFGEVRTSLLYENFLVLILKLEFSGDGGQIRTHRHPPLARTWSPVLSVEMSDDKMDNSTRGKFIKTG
jgi:hypothetical protein